MTETKNPPVKQEESEKLSRRTGDEENPEHMLGKVQEILNEYNNEESAIPLNSEYWSLLNRYRAATNKPEPKNKK